MATQTDSVSKRHVKFGTINSRPKGWKNYVEGKFCFKKNSTIWEWPSLVHIVKSIVCTFSKLKFGRFQLCRIFIFSTITTQTDSVSKLSSLELLIADPKAGRIMSKVNFVFKNSKVLEWFSLVHIEKSAACTFSKLKLRRFQFCQIFIFSAITTQNNSVSKYHVKFWTINSRPKCWKNYVEGKFCF